MTSTVLATAEAAALPTASAVVSGLQTFVTNVNPTDPVGAIARIAPALNIFINSLALQFPVLVTAELAAGTSAIQSVFASWQTEIAKAEAAAKAAA